MPGDWPQELTAAAQREFGEQRAGELAESIASAAAAIQRVLAATLEPFEAPPYLRPSAPGRATGNEA